ncbi:regulator SirB [Halomonas alkaliantarctica]|nr:regulator SirB [Halomonas alkaliantarctica]
MLKHLHISMAYLSLLFFIVRAVWAVRETPMLQARWVKVVPHVIDTALLTFGVLLAITLNFWPLPGWLSAKLVALILYIALGTMAIKRAKTPAMRAGFALAAVVVFIYMLGAAIQRTPLSWLG